MSARMFDIDPDETLVNASFVLGWGCDAFQARLE